LTLSRFIISLSFYEPLSDALVRLRNPMLHPGVLEIGDNPGILLLSTESDNSVYG